MSPFQAHRVSRMDLSIPGGAPANYENEVVAHGRALGNVVRGVITDAVRLGQAGSAVKNREKF